MKNLILVLVGLITVNLVGCTSSGSKPLYHWGKFPEQTYLLMVEPEKASVQEQIIILERDLERAKARNEAVPPGFYAHLGLLNLDINNMVKATEYFKLERQVYPESGTLMNRLLHKITGQSDTGSTP